MTAFARKRAGLVAAASFIAVTVVGVAGGSLAAASGQSPQNKGGQPASSPLTNTSMILSKTEANKGDVVHITALVTVRSTGQDVQPAPGELAIQYCVNLSTLEPSPASVCGGGAGRWLDYESGPPPVLGIIFDTTPLGEVTVGFRALYRPKGSGWAGSHSASIDLIIHGPAVDVSISLSEYSVHPGAIVDITARATVRSTGADVPSSAGEVRIEWCLSPSTLEVRPASYCDSATPTGIWAPMDDGPPPVFITYIDTTGLPAPNTIGFRGRYLPMGSGYASGVSPSVDLVVTNGAPPPPPNPPPPPPPTGPIAGVYCGTFPIWGDVGPLNCSVLSGSLGGTGRLRYLCDLSGSCPGYDVPSALTIQPDGTFTGVIANCPGCSAEGHVTGGSQLGLQFTVHFPGGDVVFTGTWVGLPWFFWP